MYKSHSQYVIEISLAEFNVNSKSLVNIDFTWHTEITKKYPSITVNTSSLPHTYCLWGSCITGPMAIQGAFCFLTVMAWLTHSPPVNVGLSLCKSCWSVGWSLPWPGACLPCHPSRQDCNLPCFLCMQGSGVTGLAAAQRVPAALLWNGENLKLIKIRKSIKKKHWH